MIWYLKFYLIRYIKDTILNFLVYCSSSLDKALHLKSNETIVQGKGLNCAEMQQESIITSSTFCAVFADASIKMSPFSLANCSPSSKLTARLWDRSHLFPTSIIVMLAFACCLASSSQLARWLKVSLLKSIWHKILTPCSARFRKPCA